MADVTEINGDELSIGERSQLQTFDLSTTGNGQTYLVLLLLSVLRYRFIKFLQILS